MTSNTIILSNPEQILKQYKENKITFHHAIDLMIFFIEHNGQNIETILKHWSSRRDLREMLETSILSILSENAEKLMDVLK